MATKKPPAKKQPRAEEGSAVVTKGSEPGAFDAAACWGRIERWFAERHPAIDLKLRPAATEKVIAAAEKQLDVRLPADFRASLLVHDGQGDEPGVFLFPHSERLGSLKGMVACWKGDRSSYDKRDVEGRFAWLDDGRRVRQVHFHPKHVAFAGSTYWDYGRLLFDFVPGPDGGEGQVIARSDVDFVFVCSSFGALLERTATGLEDGTIVLQSDPEPYGTTRLVYTLGPGKPVKASEYFA